MQEDYNLKKDKYEREKALKEERTYTADYREAAKTRGSEAITRD